MGKDLCITYSLRLLPDFLIVLSDFDLCHMLTELEHRLP